MAVDEYGFVGSGDVAAAVVAATGVVGCAVDPGFDGGGVVPAIAIVPPLDPFPEVVVELEPGAESADAHTSNTKAYVRTTATAAAHGCDMAGVGMRVSVLLLARQASAWAFTTKWTGLAGQSFPRQDNQAAGPRKDEEEKMVLWRQWAAIALVV